jgi:hypothetical protein
MGLLGKLFRPKVAAPGCAIHPDDRDLVRPEDLEWWDSLSLADCRALERRDSADRLAAFKKLTEVRGLAGAAAGERVRLGVPTYYRTLEHREDEKFYLSARDAKLPYVLQGRVQRAVRKRVIDERALAHASSFNALVRQLIRQGRI